MSRTAYPLLWIFPPRLSAVILTLSGKTTCHDLALPLSTAFFVPYYRAEWKLLCLVSMGQAEKCSFWRIYELRREYCFANRSSFVVSIIRRRETLVVLFAKVIFSNRRLVQALANTEAQRKLNILCSSISGSGSKLLHASALVRLVCLCLPDLDASGSTLPLRDAGCLSIFSNQSVFDSTTPRFGFLDSRCLPCFMSSLCSL